MSDRNDQPASGDLRVGQVLNRSFALLFGDFLRFFVTTLVIWLPFLVLDFFGQRYLAGIADDPENLDRGTLIRGLLIVFALLVLAVALTVLGQAVILYGAVQKMRGGSFSTTESVARGFGRFLPILGMLMVTVLAATAAALLLIFPAFIVLTMWYVALPACLVERLGPLQSLSRSSFLTRGHRWKVFGIWILVLVVESVVQQVLERGLGPGLVGTVADGMWLVLGEAYQAIVVAVLYHDLRVAKEGIDVERIAAVFD